MQNNDVGTEVEKMDNILIPHIIPKTTALDILNESLQDAYDLPVGK